MIIGAARAGGDRGLHIGLLAQRQHDAAHQAATRAGISAMVMAMMTFCTLPRVSAISAIASRIGGIDIRPSITRMTMASSAADEAGDQADRQCPTSEASSATEKPTVSDTRAPYSTRE